MGYGAFDCRCQCYNRESQSLLHALDTTPRTTWTRGTRHITFSSLGDQIANKIYLFASFLLRSSNCLKGDGIGADVVVCWPVLPLNFSDTVTTASADSFNAKVAIACLEAKTPSSMPKDS